ncbi:MAG TPA: hotdog fold thioesterase, partial [Saprospiraceae bacterium]|nr:hotdog fold thioesterase [Saprospiraceae bacterium]
RMNSIVEHMYNGDAFSQWLGIRRLEEGPGFCILEMEVRPEMVNGFGIAHGGITYALADSALAFASNSHGRKSVSIETSINHVKPVMAGDIIKAEAKESSLSHKLGIYHIRVTRGEELVAHFKGVVYRKEEEWNV